MPNRPAFARQLQLYGPTQSEGPAVSLHEARAYCRHLARTHYENFTVASCLLPRALRQHFYHIYAYCRWSDDLADEPPDARESAALLDWWEAQLDACYRGRARHPVFVALAETIAQFDIPREPLADLLIAFRQDGHVTRYESFDDLLGYCRHSANPVGRLVLYLGRCHGPRQVELSDAICTGLQLVNFLQDIEEDWQRGRVYLPQESLRQHGYDEAQLSTRTYNDAFRELMAAECERAQGFLRRGLPLVDLVPRELALDVWLFAHGGLQVLERLQDVDYDIWNRRPTLSKLDALRLLVSGWWKTRGRGHGAGRGADKASPETVPGATSKAGRLGEPT